MWKIKTCTKSYCECSDAVWLSVSTHRRTITSELYSSAPGCPPPSAWQSLPPLLGTPFLLTCPQKLCWGSCLPAQWWKRKEDCTCWSGTAHPSWLRGWESCSEQQHRCHWQAKHSEVEGRTQCPWSAPNLQTHIVHNTLTDKWCVGLKLTIFQGSCGNPLPFSHHYISEKQLDSRLPGSIAQCINTEFQPYSSKNSSGLTSFCTFLTSIRCFIWGLAATFFSAHSTAMSVTSTPTKCQPRSAAPTRG